MATGPVVTLRKLWRHNRWLTLSFLITLTLALFFIIRASVFFVYWQNHTDEPIEGWMTVRYIANSYRVDPELVHDAIGLPRTGPDRRPLIRIAREDGRPLDQMATTIIEAIEADRKARGIPNSDLPDPVPSGQP
ncbi:hypothetical protein OEG84_06000 [Hoeflea sp. G2-23]|uniref:Uncharacterized protein n=1 Tax=Hoeflea algicola TaxID=2983763 RepID=A0ABT3Z7F6_9HYPH|nr:hypothetical protein [Hoeflea algicola]MCY0147274.1 hypothetical protein [Hoeflea algicola]